jgi:hypothetical protein
VSELVGDFAMLQTRRSPSFVCVANISDFWRDEEACHASVTIGEGPREVVRLWRIVNLGCSAAIRRDPLENLAGNQYKVLNEKKDLSDTQGHMFYSPLPELKR